MSFSFKVKGVDTVSAYLLAKKKKTTNDINDGVKKATLFLEGEVKQSIAGHRAEPKSVDTGRFLNSVKSTQKKKLTANIETNVSYAGVLEYGGVGRKPRKHFQNTATRNTKKVQEFIEKKVKEAIR